MTSGRDVNHTHKFSRIIKQAKARKTLVMVLSCFVVFVTTYLLILPAITLDQDEAAKQGGIDVPAQSVSYEGKGYKVSATYNEEALPEGTRIEAKEIGKSDEDYAALQEDALQAVREDSGDKAGSLAFAKFYDISMISGEEAIEPDGPVDVTISFDKKLQVNDADNLRIVHFAVDEKSGETVLEVLDAGRVAAEVEDGKLTETTFEADSFSVYAVVYTVDFAYDVDGKNYTYSIEGGSKISLAKLLKELNVIKDDPDTELDERQLFLDEIDNVEFSSPELLSVEQNEDGEWTLTSRKAFDSEETLTVTMKNGDVFTVKVTDEQITTMFLSDNGKQYEVTVTYDADAKIPEGAKLQVTEFAAGSKKYLSARKAVLADKIERGETVDASTLGMAALDISILDAEGKEIEPAAPVQVDMKIKALPGVEDLGEVADTLAVQHHVEVKDGVVVETVFDGKTNASFKMETDETVAAEGTVIDPDSVREEDVTAPIPAYTDNRDIKFEVTAFSTFTISWNYAYGNGVKVHYVDENGNELNVKNSKFLTNLNSSSTSPAYLIYDIEGYEYDHTYRRFYYNGDLWNSAGWYSRNIVPQLRRGDYGWGYSADGNNWSYLSGSDAQRKDEIYVVYKKKNEVTQGGTPTVKQSGDVDPPVDPRINKESTPNGDDTNTLALSLISDTAALEVEKLADVIVVFDVSGSMTTNDMGGKTRLKAAQDAVKELATQLAQKKNSAGDPLVRMSLIQFSTKASPVLGLTDLTTDGNNSGLSQIESAVDNLSADGGTNWDHALQLANEENDLDPGRATFVIFVTDGDPTFRNTRMDVTDLDLQKETNDGAMSQYGIEAPNPFYLEDDVYGPGDNDKTTQCYAAAKEQGIAIVSAKKNIYTIGISEDVTKIQTFNEDINGNGAYLAANSSALQQAFADIEASISGASGWGNIKMTDGITNLSNTVQKTGLTNVGGDFSYWIAPAPENWSSMSAAQKKAYKPDASAFVEWDPEAAGAALANYNETTGAVEWNMGSTFMPEAGVTYQVRFKVWPSQEAYDYIAKLNNGTLNYDTLPADVKAQIIKSGNTYTLKTNEPNANTTYQSAIRTGDTVTVSGDTKTLKFPSVEDLNLSVDKMKVQKEWINDLDPDARWKSDVTLLLTDGEDNLYKSIDLNEENNYTAEDNFISCGLAKIENGEMVIYEQGHDFKLTEPAQYAYYWDLDSQVYRPMVINAQLTMLVKTDAPSGMGTHTYYEEQGQKYYKIGDGVYKSVSTGDSAATIIATNIRRSNLNLTKKVVDEEGNPVISSDAFTFTITINDPKDEDIWFSVQTDANDTNTVVKELSTNATAEIRDGQKTGYYHAVSGSQITVTIEPGWNLRFTNLPNGTTYTITENTKENYTFENASIDNNGTFSIESGTTTGNGTINESNKQYTVTYKNKAKTHQVEILKTSQDSITPLPGAVFSLYTESGYNSDPKTASKTGLTSDGNGKIDLGTLAYGKYYLVETSAPAGYISLEEPVIITVTGNGVTYNQKENIQSVDGTGIHYDQQTDTYTLTVTNNSGVELPSAGGPGTVWMYLLGSLLLLGSGIALVTRRRMRI